MQVKDKSEFILQGSGLRARDLDLSLLLRLQDMDLSLAFLAGAISPPLEKSFPNISVGTREHFSAPLRASSEKGSGPGCILCPIRDLNWCSCGCRALLGKRGA